MNGLSVQMVFSPQNCSLEWLDRTLTSGLRGLADRIIARIEDGIRTRTSHHTLIIGPRGKGKTHLLTYIWKELQNRHADDLSLKIICLSEEERGITSLLDFLVASLRAAGTPTADVASEIMDGNYPTPMEAAFHLFHQKASGKCTLIVVENLSDIFDSLEEAALADLRGFFQDHPSISLLASSVNLFENSSKADHPFYGFFNIHPLRPLSRGEARTYLSTLALAKGDRELGTVLNKEEAQARVNAIYDLTGGNHRLLAMLSAFLSAEGLAELVGPFVEMADKELTPYFQQRLDRLTPHQNKLLRAIADHHGRALSVNEIARVTFLTPQSVSRQLYDLLHGGYVARKQVGRESCYDLRESLLRLVLDIKEGRDRPLPLIVNLLKNWYNVRELRKLAAMAPEHARFYYDAALVEKRQAEAGDIRAFAHMHLPMLKIEATGDVKQEILSKVIAHANKGQHSEALNLLEKLIRKDVHSPMAWAIRGDVLRMSGRREEALTAYDEVVERFGTSEDPEPQVSVASALVNKGATLGQLNRSQEAIGLCDEVVKRFGSSDREELQVPVALALVNKGATLGQLNRSQEAIGLCDEVVKRFGNSHSEELLQQVASALVNKGATLGQLNRSEAAIALCDEVEKRFGDSDHSELLEQVAKALINKGVALGQLNRNEEAIALYDDIQKRFDDSDHPELLEQVAKAMFNKGATLGQLNQSEEAIALYDDIQKRFDESDHPELLRLVAKALINKGVTLGQLNQSEEAIAVYDEVVEQYGSSEQPEVLEQVANSLINKGVALGQLNRSEEAILLYDEVEKRFGDSDHSELLEQVAKAMFNKGATLGQLNRSEEAIALYDDIQKRFDESDHPEFLEQVAMALVNKGATLWKLNRSEEAIALCDKVEKRFGDSDRLELLEQVANALFNKGVALGISVRPRAALAAFESALRIQPDNPSALGARVEALACLRREDEALRSLDEMLKVIPEPHWSRSLIVSRLLNIDRFVEDEDLLRQVVVLYRTDKDSLVGGLISWIQDQIPLSKSAAEQLEVTENTLRSAFAEISEAEYALAMLKAVRRDAMGDRKALLQLPVELRRLVESSQAEGTEAGKNK